MFGSTPTASIGAGLSIGNSFTVNLTDFKVQNLSDSARVHHKYLMASSSGGSYDDPEGLMDSSAKGQLSGTKLFDVPDLAKYNMPLASQAIFIDDPR